MTASTERKTAVPAPPTIAVHITEPNVRRRKGFQRCEIGSNIEFSTRRLETYCLAEWDPIVFDALLVAAAAEFADRTLRRVAFSWPRNIELHIPVHDLHRWSDGRVTTTLRKALDFLTGDCWNITFYGRRRPLEPPLQGQFTIPDGSSAIIPFSDGLDSRCVAGLLSRDFGSKLIRMRLGSKVYDGKALARQRHPFTSVPYSVRQGEQRFAESSVRSRGFKFALLSGLAAYLSGAEQIIVPESGQGALGPSLVTAGQGYEDYRSHPSFTRHIESLLQALLNYRVRYVFPRLWYTKGETLQTFLTECQEGSSWAATWSCWQQTRQVSVNRKKRQCGICAACMLRRMSIHAAGLAEEQTAYVWENLAAASFESGAAASFPRKKITRAMREYAIAGTLHLDHFAALDDRAAGTIDVYAFRLSRALCESEADIKAKLGQLISRHSDEWSNFVNSLGSTSFVADWAVKGRS